VWGIYPTLGQAAEITDTAQSALFGFPRLGATDDRDL
jgi:hypothetical protein